MDERNEKHELVEEVKHIQEEITDKESVKPLVDENDSFAISDETSFKQESMMVFNIVDGLIEIPRAK